MTKDEIRLVVFILFALTLGGVVSFYRSPARKVSHEASVSNPIAVKSPATAETVKSDIDEDP